VSQDGLQARAANLYVWFALLINLLPLRIPLFPLLINLLCCRQEKMRSTSNNFFLWFASVGVNETLLIGLNENKKNNQLDNWLLVLVKINLANQLVSIAGPSCASCALLLRDRVASHQHQ
jgi:hypothetical protein